jgi:crossover junction endodeoxyribonuclease RusA
MVGETQQYILPFPPSVNSYWRAVVRGKIAVNILSERGRKYRKDADEAIHADRAVCEPLTGRLQVSLDLHPPTLRKYDCDNFPKAVLDALTHAGVWQDDEQIDQLNVLKCPKDKDDPRVVVTITEIEPCNETS